MNGNTDEVEARDVPPYFSGTTFANFIEAHRRTLPTRIDRSIMGNVAGGDQVRILRALRFFGLISDDGFPTETFHRLSLAEPDEMQTFWEGLLRMAYPYLFSAFNLEKATQAQIEERFREQGIKGDTVRKAVSFFITLARLAGLKLSPYFKATRPRGPRATRVLRKVRTSSREPDMLISDREAAERGASHVAKVVRFRSGGTATLSVSIDMFSMSKADRETLFEWLDMMNQYEAQGDGLSENS